LFAVTQISASTRTNFHLQNRQLQDKKYFIADKYLEKYPSIIIVNISTQKLQLFKKGKLTTSYSISTSRIGLGQKEGSGRTPIGLHKICEKIGENAPPYGIFVGRKFTGKIWTPRYNNTDHIVTRILRLEGLENGLNKGKDHAGTIVDSKQRSIYIHGTAMAWKLGHPTTIGCIYMKSNDVIKLFDEVAVGTIVFITT
jgi:lipoprotein-anchoring transpeptidase ErfK/SrfK